MEVHHVQRVTHLLLHYYVVSLVAYHIVDRHLTLPPALLRCHWHVVGLVHGVLVTLACILLAIVLVLLVRVLHYFVHLDLVSD